MLDQKSLVQKTHRLRSTATNNIVEENQEVNQDHRGGLNIRGQGRGKRVAGARGRGKVPALPEETVSIVENHFQEHCIKDICRNAHLKTLTHMFKITSIHHTDSEEENRKINFPIAMILSEVCETNSNSTFFLKRFLRKNQGTMRMTVL